jgi:hypothetical protein
MGLPISDEALILIAMIILLSGVLRWFFGSDTGRRADRKLAKARDYGLLAEVATAPSEQAAKFVQDQLRRNGIRATTAPADDGVHLRVLVFPADARAAADLLLRDD